MAAPDSPSTPPEKAHEERVHGAFDDLESRLGDRADDSAKGALSKLREAAARRDADATRQGLASVREQHGWLWEEMSRHPRVASLIDELALWGF
jgi:hypothetical protein